MTRQTNNSHIQREILAAKLRAITRFVRGLQQPFLGLDIAECASVSIPGGRQMIEITGGGKFNGFETCFGRGSADDERQVIWRATGGASVIIFSVRNFSKLPGFSRALVSWYSEVLFADPPPLVTNRNWYSMPSVAIRSICAGKLVPVSTSSYMFKGAVWE